MTDMTDLTAMRDMANMEDMAEMASMREKPGITEMSDIIVDTTLQGKISLLYVICYRRDKEINLN